MGLNLQPCRTQDEDGGCGRKRRQEGTKDLPFAMANHVIQHLLPWNGTLDILDPKKDPPLSPWTATRMIIPNTGIRPLFRGRQHSEIWPLPHHQRLDTMQLKMRKAQALCSVSSHPPGFCLFSIFVSVVCVVVGLSHHSYHSHFLHFTNIHPLGTPICPAQSSGAQKNVLYCWWRSWTAFILLSWEVGGALR